MDHDDYADMFRFPMGACVRWADQPHTRCYVYQRRWTDREHLDPVVQYRLRFVKAGTAYGIVGDEWVYEPDLEPWGDEASPPSVGDPRAAHRPLRR